MYYYSQHLWSVIKLWNHRLVNRIIFWFFLVTFLRTRIYILNIFNKLVTCRKRTYRKECLDSSLFSKALNHDRFCLNNKRSHYVFFNIRKIEKKNSKYKKIPKNFPQYLIKKVSILSPDIRQLSKKQNKYYFFRILIKRSV